MEMMTCCVYITEMREEMIQYLEDVKFAVESIIGIVWTEYTQIEQLEREIRKLERVIQFNMNRVQNLALSDDDDDYLLAVQGQWDSYFGEEKDQYNKNRDVESLRKSFDTKKFSINCLSSTLLQIAKQGITTTFPAPKAQQSFERCPNGRSVGSQPLKIVLRQARNQSMHYDEENSMTQWLNDCFDNLTQEFGKQFADYQKTNKAFEVIKLLNWRSFANFKMDMMSFVSD